MMQESSVVNPWVPVVMTVLSIVVTIGVAVVGWAFKQVYDRFASTHSRIDEVKDDMIKLIGAVKEDAESKRIETRDTILELVNEKFDSIKETMRDIKDEIKGNHREV